MKNTEEVIKMKYVVWMLMIMLIGGGNAVVDSPQLTSR